MLFDLAGALIASYDTTAAAATRLSARSFPLCGGIGPVRGLTFPAHRTAAQGQRPVMRRTDRLGVGADTTAR